MTEYLVRIKDQWEIGHPGAIGDDTEKCIECAGTGIRQDQALVCPHCEQGRVRVRIRTMRLAWFDRNSAMICFDYQEPEVKELPE